MFDMCSRNEESVVSKCVEGRAVGKHACGGPPTSLSLYDPLMALSAACNLDCLSCVSTQKETCNCLNRFY